MVFPWFSNENLTDLMKIHPSFRLRALSRAKALASLDTTRTVAARGSLRKRARSPKYCLDA